MRFFTPPLYTDFNSPHEDESAVAGEAWDSAVVAYQRQLAGLPNMARQMVELDLHDAELLADDSLHCRFPIAIVTLTQREELATLAYVLAGPIWEISPPYDWPFSPRAVTWLYDEVDVSPSQRLGEFIHRVLLSDGRVLQIPFTSATHQRVPLRKLFPAH